MRGENRVGGNKRRFVCKRYRERKSKRTSEYYICAVENFLCRHSTRMNIVILCCIGCIVYRHIHPTFSGKTSAPFRICFRSAPGEQIKQLNFSRDVKENAKRTFGYPSSALYFGGCDRSSNRAEADEPCRKLIGLGQWSQNGRRCSREGANVSVVL